MPSLSRAVAVAGHFGAAIVAHAEEAGPAVFNVREGTLGYTITHKPHQVRGTTHDFEGKVVVAPDGTRSGSRLRANFSFAISLDDLKIRRPALLFVRVEDQLMIEGDLLLE